MGSVSRDRADTHLGEMLRLYRMVRNITVRQLAPEIGVSIATLSRVERGYEMDLRTFEKFLAWFRQTPETKE